MPWPSADMPAEWGLRGWGVGDSNQGREKWTVGDAESALAASGVASEVAAVAGE